MGPCQPFLPIGVLIDIIIEAMTCFQLKDFGIPPKEKTFGHMCLRNGP